MPLSAGDKLGPYKILAPLGAGGMGEVYRANDTRLDLTVAVKVLPASLSSDPSLKQRLEREAKANPFLSQPPTRSTIAIAGHFSFLTASTSSTTLHRTTTLVTIRTLSTLPRFATDKRKLPLGIFPLDALIVTTFTIVGNPSTSASKEGLPVIRSETMESERQAMLRKGCVGSMP